MRYAYDAFVKMLVATGPAARGNRYRFSTKPVEEGSGLVYYGYRYYDPVTGRWPSRDPIGEMGGVNVYGMVGNGSVVKHDVLGMGLWEDLQALKAAEALEKAKHATSCAPKCGTIKTPGAVPLMVAGVALSRYTYHDDYDACLDAAADIYFDCLNRPGGGSCFSEEIAMLHAIAKCSIKVCTAGF